MSVAANSGFVELLRISAARRKLRSQHAVVEQVVTKELWDTMRDGLPRVLVVVYIQKIFHIPLTVYLFAPAPCLFCMQFLTFESALELCIRPHRSKFIRSGAHVIRRPRAHATTHCTQTNQSRSSSMAQHRRLVYE